MRRTEIKLDKRLQRFMDRIRIVPSLDPKVVAQERAKFLAQGESFRFAVSQPKNRRHIGWINTLTLALQRKEPSPMLNTLMAVIVTISLLFGGAGATVYAAQGSLPDEALYPVKTWSEDARLSLAGSAQEKLELTLEFTNRRVAEIVSMQANAHSITAKVALRLQEELETALQIAAGMDDPQMMQALEQIRLQAETQSRNIEALMVKNSGQGAQTLTRIQDWLQEQVRLAEAGEADPQGFRLLVRNRDRQNRPSQTPNPSQPGRIHQTPGVTPDPTGNSYGPGPSGSQATGTPGHYGPGEPNPSQTPMPTGGSFGPGPGAGQQTTTPGEYGPGLQAGTSTCTPAQNGDGSGPGPNPSQTPQSGGPGSGQATSTQQPVGPGPGQVTVTPQQGGNPVGGQTTTPGLGGKP